MAAVMITGYLPKEVTDSKHKSARSASAFIRSVVKNANGKITKLEVMMGNIFVTLKDGPGATELEVALKGLEGVLVKTPTEAQLIFTKERARVEADIVAENAANKELLAKTAV
jgi:hypothetical protein